MTIDNLAMFGLGVLASLPLWALVLREDNRPSYFRGPLNHAQQRKIDLECKKIDEEMRRARDKAQKEELAKAYSVEWSREYKDSTTHREKILTGLKRRRSTGVPEHKHFKVQAPEGHRIDFVAFATAVGSNMVWCSKCLAFSGNWAPNEDAVRPCCPRCNEFLWTPDEMLREGKFVLVGEGREVDIEVAL